jgi:hypothetical protein
MRSLPLLLGVALALAMAACGDPIPKAEGEPGSGFPHPEGWLEGHWDAGRENPEACYFCHEEEGQTDIDYLGGEALPPCNGCHAWPLPERTDDGEETAARCLPTGIGAG